MGHWPFMPHKWGESYEFDGEKAWGGNVTSSGTAWYRDCTIGGCKHYQEWSPSEDRWVKGLYDHVMSPRRQHEEHVRSVAQMEASAERAKHNERPPERR